MFSNFTEQYGVGTGNVIALTDPTEGNIEFSKSFANGDLVSYSIRNIANGVKVTGIGVYDAVNDTITRNDNWSYDGTTVDKDPVANIDLGTGAIVITCVQHIDTLKMVMAAVTQAAGEPMPARPVGFNVVYWLTVDEPTIGPDNPFDVWANATVSEPPVEEPVEPVVEEPTPGDFAFYTSDNQAFITSDGQEFLVSDGQPVTEPTPGEFEFYTSDNQVFMTSDGQEFLVSDGQQAPTPTTDEFALYTSDNQAFMTSDGQSFITATP